jgi:hypothetical protein
MAQYDPATDGKVIVPDVVDGQFKGVFRYLPRAVPIDYSEELRVYREAMELIRTAA